MTSEEFSEIRLPVGLETAGIYELLKLPDPSLGCFEHDFPNYRYNVWKIHKDSVSKLYSIPLQHHNVKIRDVFGFTNSGMPLVSVDLESGAEDIAVFDPNSATLTSFGVVGNPVSGFVASYKETLLLLDHADPATCSAPTWMKKGSYARICLDVTPLQEERLRRLKNRTKVYFISTRVEHQEALRVLWSSTFPDEKLDDLISDQWNKMGWQGKDPSTDFRGAGFISLENLLFFAKTFSVSFQRLIRKQGTKGVAYEYPFAVAGVNITFMLMKLLDLDATKPRTLVSAVFVHMLSENEWAFDLLYCVAFAIMDKKWVNKKASYMEFNDILKSTRAQLEEELLLDDVLRIEEMPIFSSSSLTQADDQQSKMKISTHRVATHIQ